MRNMILSILVRNLHDLARLLYFPIIFFLSYCVEIPARFALLLFNPGNSGKTQGSQPDTRILTFNLGLASTTVTRNVHELKKWRTWLQC